MRKIILLSLLLCCVILSSCSSLEPTTTTTTTTTTTIATTTTTITTTTTTSTTTTTFPKEINILGIQDEGGKLYVHVPKNSFEDEVFEVHFDNYKYIIDSDLICDDGNPKYVQVRLRYRDVAENINKQDYLSGDYCKEGSYEFLWE
jgi:hypothetical protein